MLGMVAVFAQSEREVLVERVRAGLAIARAKGVKLGRRPKSVDLDAAPARLEAGVSLRAIAQELGVHHRTLARRLGDGARRATTPVA